MEIVNPGVSESSLEDAGSLVASAFLATQASHVPKHLRLYEAIMSCIDSGQLSQGQKIPGERELCGATGLSLGTVQRALTRLVSESRIERKHGKGTFVKHERLAIADLWHYRFRNPDDRSLLAVFAKLTARTRVVSDPVVTEALGSDAAGFIRLDRVINVGDRFSCWSEMFLPYSRFGKILTLPEVEIEAVCIKLLLAEKFGAVTARTEQTITVQKIPDAIAREINIESHSTGVLLKIVGSSFNGVPISYQKIYVPATPYEMEIGSDAALAVSAVA